MQIATNLKPRCSTAFLCNDRNVLKKYSAEEWIAELIMVDNGSAVILLQNKRSSIETHKVHAGRRKD